MSEFIPEQESLAPTFVPTTDEPQDPLDALATLENSLEAQPSDVDLIVAEETPPPVGRGWAYDWTLRRFVLSGGSAVATRGELTLAGWIEKCLRTARGAHPIHPDGYGMPPGQDLVGGPVGVLPADLEDRIRDALTFHPRITDVQDVTFAYDPDDFYLATSFTVVIDGGDPLTVQNLTLSL